MPDCLVPVGHVALPVLMVLQTKAAACACLSEHAVACGCPYGRSVICGPGVLKEKRKRGLLRGMGTALLALSPLAGRIGVPHYRPDSSLSDLAARHFWAAVPRTCLCPRVPRSPAPGVGVPWFCVCAHVLLHAPDRCQRTTLRPAAASRSQQTGPQPGRAPQGTAGIRIGTHGDMLQHVKGRRQGKGPGKGRV